MSPKSSLSSLGTVKLAALSKTEHDLSVKRQGALQSAILNSANFSSIATDERGIIQLFNVGAERMLGYSAEDVINRITPADISDPQELLDRAEALSLELGTPITPGFEALVFKASRGIEDIYELTYVRRDGSRFPAVVSVTALRDANEAIIGFLLIGTDNTARKQVEAERERLDQELREKNLALGAARLAAEKANLAKSEFLSSMSHELRSPLNAILGFAQLMGSDVPPPSRPQRERIEYILNAGWHLLTLINDILDLAKVESGQLPLSIEPVSLGEVFVECEAMVAPETRALDIQLTFPPLANPCFLLADRTRLKQVLLNLISNAVKYNVRGGRVDVDVAETAPGRLRVSVRDTGEGLSPSQVSHLFEAFNRLGRERGTVEGTGIGLVVAQRLVELMGGQIGADSTVGVGSVFWFELAQCSELQHTFDPVAAEAFARQNVVPGVRRQSVLYVEDNPANMVLVEQIIGRHTDLKLLTATNATTGIAIARSELPDVILMDINLPDFSGFEALRMLKQESATAGIPVIAISAYAMSPDVEMGLKAGFFKYLTKPLNISEFQKALELALSVADSASAKK